MADGRPARLIIRNFVDLLLLGGAEYDMPYPDIANPDLLERIPSGARLILDVGCGSGILGSEIKRRNPAAQVLGVEVDPAPAATAATRLDRVFVTNLDIDPVPFS